MDCRSSEGSLTVESHTHLSTDPSRCMSFLHNTSAEQMINNYRSIVDRCDVGQIQLTIETLPDDALIYVFYFYVTQASEVEAWHTLVHLCKRWRNLVFGSPLRLNLRIACTNKTPVREMLDIWPPLPIVISGRLKRKTNLNNVKAALEHHDRVCKIMLFFARCNPEDLIASLEIPFPILTGLNLNAFTSRSFEADPSKFLCGSTQLRSLTLTCIRIPDILKSLTSTPNLVILRLDRIGSFLSDEMVTVLSALTRLEILELHVEIRRSHPDWENRHLAPLTRTVLSSLTVLKVRGDTEDLEDLVARIDAPLLGHLYVLVSFPVFDRVIVLDAPHLLRFISRIPKLQTPDEAYIGFDADEFKIWIVFFFSTLISPLALRLEIFCFEPKEQFPCLARFCRSPPLTLQRSEYLCIGEGQFSQQRQRKYTENTQWLELLQPFVAVKNLYLAKDFTLHIAYTLQGLVGVRVMEVLPALANVFIDEFELSVLVHKVLKEFVVARQLAGHPIIISGWDIKQY